MTTTQLERPVSTNRFNHLQPHVTLLLLIDEFVRASSEIDNLRKLLDELAQPAPTLPRRKSSETLKMMPELLDRLLPSSDERLIDHPWHSPSSSLAKLRRYGAELAADLPDLEPAQELYRSLAKTCQAVALAAEQPDFLSLSKVARLLDRTGQLLATLMRSFNRDENILYYLVCHQRELDRCYKRGFARHFLESAHPNGIEGVKTLMIRRYRQRGFPHIAQEIAQQLTELA